MGKEYRLVSAAIALLCLAVGLAENINEDLPPGIADLQNAQGGGGFDIFIEETSPRWHMHRARKVDMDYRWRGLFGGNL